MRPRARSRRFGPQLRKSSCGLLSRVRSRTLHKSHRVATAYVVTFRHGSRPERRHVPDRPAAAGSAADRPRRGRPRAGHVADGRAQHRRRRPAPHREDERLRGRAGARQTGRQLHRSRSTCSGSRTPPSSPKRSSPQRSRTGHGCIASFTERAKPDGSSPMPPGRRSCCGPRTSSAPSSRSPSSRASRIATRSATSTTRSRCRSGSRRPTASTRSSSSTSSRRSPTRASRMATPTP